MIRVVIDTNVVVSALLQSRGLPEAVVSLALSGDVQWFASEPILQEYSTVLGRRKLAIHPARVVEAMSRIRAAVSIVEPTVKITAAGDPDDNIFLECSQAAEADYIVTGNIRHFPEVWGKTRIVSPRQFIDSWTSSPESSP
jgi:uncharacterized protein